MMLNIIVVGKSGVGKTSLINRFISDTFQSDLKPTVGMTFALKTLTAQLSTPLPSAKEIQLQIWDTAGSNSFLKQINQAYINAFWKNVAGFIVVSDAAD